MSKVLAKFRILECKSDRTAEYVRDPETKEYARGKPALVTQLKLTAVQGEPFGSATPSGNVDMLIKNPAAAALFRDAWDEYTHSDDPDRQPPEFYVMFQLDHGQGWES